MSTGRWRWRWRCSRPSALHPSWYERLDCCSRNYDWLWQRSRREPLGNKISAAGEKGESAAAERQFQGRCWRRRRSRLRLRLH